MPAHVYSYCHILSLLPSCSSCWAIVPLTLRNNGILNRWHYWASAHVCHKIIYHAFMEQGSTCAARLCIVVTHFDKCSTRLMLWFRAFWSCVCGHTWDWGIWSVVARHEWYYWCFGCLLYETGHQRFWSGLSVHDDSLYFGILKRSINHQNHQVTLLRLLLTYPAIINDYV